MFFFFQGSMHPKTAIRVGTWWGWRISRKRNEARAPCLAWWCWYLMNSAGEGQLGEPLELCQLGPVGRTCHIICVAQCNVKCRASLFKNYEVEDSKRGTWSQGCGVGTGHAPVKPLCLTAWEKEPQDSKDFFVGELLWATKALNLSTVKWVSQRLGGANSLIHTQEQVLFDV